MEVVALVVTALGVVIGLVELRDSLVARKKRHRSVDHAALPVDSTSDKLTAAAERRTGYDHATEAALELLPDVSPVVSCKYIETPAELRDLWRIDDEAYADASIPYSLFEDWWTAYPKGLKAIFYGDQVMGAVGLWPVSKRWSVQFCNGEVGEADLPSSALAHYRSRAACYWYASGIVLVPALRGGRAVAKLLSEALRLWEEGEQVLFPATIYALAYSKSGSALLRRLEFRLMRSRSQMPDRYPLYERVIDGPSTVVNIRDHLGSAVSP